MAEDMAHMGEAEWLGQCRGATHCPAGGRLDGRPDWTGATSGSELTSLVSLTSLVNQSG